MTNRIVHELLLSPAITLSLLVAACGDTTGGADVDAIAIDIPFFHPEGVAVADDGTIFVTGFGTGGIATAPPGASEAVELVPAGTLAGGGLGIIADSENATLWACGADFSGKIPSALYSIPFDGDVSGVVAYPLPGGGFCNDIAMGPDGTLYVTDSFVGRVLALAPGSSELELWAQEEAWAPNPEGIPLTLNGITYDPDDDVIYAGRADGGLIRIERNADGSAGATTEFSLPGGFDGLKYRAEGSLLAIFSAAKDPAGGELVELTFDEDGPTVTTISSDPEQPATLALDGEGNAWVTEARFSTLLDGDPATNAEPPFYVVRVPVP